MRWLIVLAGMVTIVFGLLCLNYTKASGLERHRAFAQRYQLPEPGNRILWSGALAISAGSGLIGYSLGSRRQNRT